MTPESIAHYRIVSKLGAGGMGEVYRATDTKLGRDVAVKVLPPSVAADPDRLARFQREAKVLASLNHPNIAAIYGVEDRAIIMELVEGPTLAERLSSGALPLDEALRIAIDIASALENAHDQGIVHRDLKPANVKAPPEGRTKVLDLGLAMVTGPAAPAASAGAADSPTLSMAATQVGLILGTAAYMSPEQASGKRVDKRADIWAFGVVLWEMLAGRTLFGGGETVSHTLADVLRAEIDFSKLPTATPPPIRELLKRCLDRDPQTRLRDIGEARVAIQRWIANPVRAVEPTPAPARPRRASLAPWLVAVLAAICGAVVAFLHFRETLPETPVIRSTILPPEGAEWSFVNGLGLPALSPDGRRIVFGARTADSKTPLWIRPVDGFTAQPLAGTDHASFPFWSPDSRFIAFFADAKLKKIDASGGPALTLADAPLGRGGSWNQDGIIIFSPRNAVNRLQRVSSAGGAVTELAVEGRLPWFLPDGRHFLYQPGAGERAGKVMAASLDGGPGKVVVDAASTNALYSQGHLLFLREGTLMAQPFDPNRLVTTGEAVPLAEQVQSALNSATAAAVTVSATGLLAYRAGEAAGRAVLAWFDRTGKQGDSLGSPAPVSTFSFSSDHKRIAATVVDRQTSDIWIFDVEGGLRTRLTFGGGTTPVWSRDGRTIVFNSNRKGHLDLYRKSADGSGAEELLYADDLQKYPSDWSPDGKFLLYMSGNSASKAGTPGIWVLPLAPPSSGAALKPLPVLQSDFTPVTPRFSPDGRWIAYSSSESGRSELYVTAFPVPASGPGARRQVSTAGINYSTPRWRADGKEIFFEAADGRIMAAEIAARGNTIDVGTIRPLFRPASTLVFARYDISADGQRLLVAAPPEQKTEPLNLIANWPAALRK